MATIFVAFVLFVVCFYVAICILLKLHNTVVFDGNVGIIRKAVWEMTADDTTTSLLLQNGFSVFICLIYV